VRRLTATLNDDIAHCAGATAHASATKSPRQQESRGRACVSRGAKVTSSEKLGGGGSKNFQRSTDPTSRSPEICGDGPLTSPITEMGGAAHTCPTGVAIPWARNLDNLHNPTASPGRQNYDRGKRRIRRLSVDDVLYAGDRNAEQVHRALSKNVMEARGEQQQQRANKELRAHTEQRDEYLKERLACVACVASAKKRAARHPTGCHTDEDSERPKSVYSESDNELDEANEGYEVARADQAEMREKVVRYDTVARRVAARHAASTEKPQGVE
jgi:hypothetical protein